MRILRYLAREVFHYFLVFIVILLLIMISNTFVHYLSQAASGALSSSAVLNLISFTLPNFLVALIPIAFFLSIVLALGKLFADSELLVLFSCGLTWHSLLKANLKMAYFLAICVAVLSLWLNPMMLSHRNQLEGSAENNSSVSDFQSGKFLSFQSGQRVIYIGRAENNNTDFSNLFIYGNKNNAQKIILAPSAQVAYSSELNEQVLVLKNGVEYKLNPLSKDTQIVHFDRYEIPINTGYAVASEENSTGQRVDSLSTLSLLKIIFQSAVEDKKINNQTIRLFSQIAPPLNELFWRLSEIVSVFVLLVMGLALCRVPPRRSRYYKIIPAVLIFIIYFNLLTMAKNWALSNWLFLILNVWWVHGIFLLFFGWILWRAERKI